MLKIKDNVDLKDLLFNGFEEADFNSKYLIRYIYIDKEINYETLYIDKDTKEIFAYDDLQDKKISMQNEWIKDIKDLVEKVKE